MKPPQDLPEELARLLEKRDKPDRRAPKPAAAASKPPVERRKKTRRKP